jgi:hypothetical protein
MKKYAIIAMLFATLAGCGEPLEREYAETMQRLALEEANLQRLEIEADAKVQDMLNATAPYRDGILNRIQERFSPLSRNEINSFVSFVNGDSNELLVSERLTNEDKEWLQEVRGSMSGDIKTLRDINVVYESILDVQYRRIEKQKDLIAKTKKRLSEIQDSM